MDTGKIQFRVIPEEEKEIEASKWIWDEFLPLKQVILWAGKTSTGKSTAILDLCSRISTGADFPNGGKNLLAGPSSIVYINEEDDLKTSILPKLKAAGADFTKFIFPKAVSYEMAAKQGYTRWDDRPITDLYDELAALEQVLVERGDVALVVIDPVTAYLGSRDANNNAEVKTFVTAMLQLSQRQNVCILLVTHMNKNALLEATERVIGSCAWTHSPRMLFMLERISEAGEATESTFICQKSNVSQLAPPLTFRIEKGELVGKGGEPVPTCRVSWEKMTEEEEEKEKGDNQKSTRGRYKERENMKEWIRRLLVRPLEATELHNLAERKELPWRRVQRALTDMLDEGEIIRTHKGGNVFMYEFTRSEPQEFTKRASEVAGVAEPDQK